MAKSDKHRVTIRMFGDHEIITPVNKLQKYVVKFVAPGDDPLTRAEAALAQMSGEFAGWMTEECDRLDAARRAVREHGFGKRYFDELFHAAHDIKGDAATFGFPLAAPAAESLCRVLEHSPRPAKSRLRLSTSTSMRCARSCANMQGPISRISRAH